MRKRLPTIFLQKKSLWLKNSNILTFSSQGTETFRGVTVQWFPSAVLKILIGDPLVFQNVMVFKKNWCTERWEAQFFWKILYRSGKKPCYVEFCRVGMCYTRSIVSRKHFPAANQRAWNTQKLVKSVSSDDWKNGCISLAYFTRRLKRR